MGKIGQATVLELEETRYTFLLGAMFFVIGAISLLKFYVAMDKYNKKRNSENYSILCLFLPHKFVEPKELKFYFVAVICLVIAIPSLKIGSGL